MRKEKNSQINDFNSELKLQGFIACEIESKVVRTYKRKDFYKMCMNTGQNSIKCVNRSYETNGTILFFSNPHFPYSWEIISSTYQDFDCLFFGSFLKVSDLSESLQ